MLLIIFFFFNLDAPPHRSKLPSELLNTFDKLLQETTSKADNHVPKTKLVEKCCVHDAIQWASSVIKLQCNSSAVHDTTQSEANETGKPRHSGHLQVLVTGSLFLVGATFQILDPNLALNMLNLSNISV